MRAGAKGRQPATSRSCSATISIRTAPRAAPTVTTTRRGSRRSSSSLTGRSQRTGADFRIYAALGNHDWKTSRAGAMAQVRLPRTDAPFYMDGLRLPGRADRRCARSRALRARHARDAVGPLDPRRRADRRRRANSTAAKSTRPSPGRCRRMPTSGDRGRGSSRRSPSRRHAGRSSSDITRSGRPRGASTSRRGCCAG